MLIRPARESDWNQWRAIHVALWPHATTVDDDAEMRAYLKNDPTSTTVVLVAEAEDGQLVGFVEAGVRAYADGCYSSNVGYIEGWYVKVEKRRQGVGAALVRAAEEWARHKGCREMASDCDENNETSLRSHLALGYEEVERLIHFRKTL